jgi:hypothetical protein
MSGLPLAGRTDESEALVVAAVLMKIAAPVKTEDRRCDLAHVKALSTREA